MNKSILTALHKSNGAALLAAGVTVFLFLASFTAISWGGEKEQRQFPSPAAAIEALVDAARSDDLNSMQAILGPGSSELLSSGDSVADQVNRGKFVIAYDAKHSLQAGTDGTTIVHIGVDDWTLPIPLVKKGKIWVFDSQKGKKEILNRRIGRNELQVIDVIDAYVHAQHEYACKDCNGGGRVEFSQRLLSTPGSHDGLYWEAKAGEEQSPLGVLIARAAKEGYRVEGNLAPFHGYYFRILKEQGADAPGGPYNYVVKGRMILGFALVAYPAEYGNSGVMTFMVNQEGIIFEKNLGTDTRRLAEAITSYNPDQSWRKVKNLETSAQN